MRKRQGKTTAKVSHVSISEALSSSIGKLHIKLKNGHEFNEYKQKEVFIKTAFDTTKLKTTTHTCNTTSHKRESVHICPWQFPRSKRARHTDCKPPSPSTVPGCRGGALYLTS